MKIGFFDSGLGGLIIMSAVTRALPQYDYVFLGDTLNVPYGNRSHEFIYEATQKAVAHLFEQDCALVIMACNTAAVTALRPLQQNWLMDHYPDRRILGVVVPTLEAAIENNHTNIGLLATSATVNSGVYEAELQKINPDIQIHSKAAPLLVPLIENDGKKWVRPILEDYLAPLLKENVQSLILGCSHYPFLRKDIEDILKEKSFETTIISQDECIPVKLEDYLQRHHEIEKKLEKTGNLHFLVTDITPSYQESANTIFGKALKLNKVTL